MKLKQLECLCALAEVKNFSKAAEQIYITQPAFSKNIASLEEELGVQLIDRTRNNVNLTEVGELVYERAQNVMLQVESIEELAAMHASGNQNSLIVGTLWGGLHAAERRLLRDYAQAEKNLNIELKEFSEKGLYDALETGIIDVGISICHLIDTIKARFNYQILQQNATCLICSRQHPLAVKEQVKIEDLKNETIIGIKADRLVYGSAYLRKMCRERGFEPRISNVADSVFIQLDLLEEGRGVSVLGDDVMMLSRRDILAIPIEGMAPSCHAVLWKKDDARRKVLNLVNYMKKYTV